jgi:hypothetical protein
VNAATAGGRVGLKLQPAPGAWPDKLNRGHFVSVFSTTADGLEQQGPLFLLEPPSRVEFSNSSGAHVDCSAHGSPPLRVEWLLADGSPALPVPQLRVLHPNGTLELPPFPAERLRHDVHSALYRCRVSNQLGATISRDVHVRAGEF